MKEKLKALIAEHQLSRLSDKLLSYAKPAIRLVPNPDKDASLGISKIGGCPDLPAGFEWPEWNDLPMSFIAQIDLREAAKFDTEGVLPKTGMLYFFYDADQATWGFDPKDRESFKVYYADVDRSALKHVAFPVELPDESIFEELFVEFRADINIPPFESDIINEFELSNDEKDHYIELREALNELADDNYIVHKLLGYSDPVQNDMPLEVQLVTNGLYCGDGKAWEDPRRKELEPGAKEWRLLLQVDTEDDINMMWGDAGRLYFWIKDSDLRAGNFDQAWMILQCY